MLYFALPTSRFREMAADLVGKTIPSSFLVKAFLGSISIVLIYYLDLDLSISIFRLEFLERHSFLICLLNVHETFSSSFYAADVVVEIS